MASGRSRNSQPSQYGHWNTLIPKYCSIPGISGSTSSTPVAINSLRQYTRRSALSVTRNPRDPLRPARETSASRKDTSGYCESSSRATRRKTSGGMPSRVRKPCIATDAQLRGVPRSHIRTRRVARPSISAALIPAGPAPTITTSHVSRAVRRMLFHLSSATSSSTSAGSSPHESVNSLSSLSSARQSETSYRGSACSGPGTRSGM